MHMVMLSAANILKVCLRSIVLDGLYEYSVHGCH